MKKIEIIWRELLYASLEKKERYFEQKTLAERFGFSTSTVFQSLKMPRQMGAVRVTGRNFTLEDPEKLLYLWASFRNFKKDISDSFRAEGSMAEIESLMPPEVIFGGYFAARSFLAVPPADYDKVYVYFPAPEKIKERLTVVKGEPNVFILIPDCFLSFYGQTTTLAQTFVDIWNAPDWYAKEYLRGLKEGINAILS